MVRYPYSDSTYYKCYYQLHARYFYVNDTLTLLIAMLR